MARGQTRCGKREAIELHGRGGLGTPIRLGGRCYVGADKQALAHGVGCQRDVVGLARGVVEHRRAVARSKDVWARLRLGRAVGSEGRGAHVLVHLDGAVWQHVEHAGEEVGAREEAHRHDQVVHAALASARDHGDTVRIGRDALDHLAQCQLDAMGRIGLLDELGHVGIEVLGQDAAEAIDERDPRPHEGDLLGQFGSDVAGAHHGHGGGHGDLLLDGPAVVPVLAAQDASDPEAFGQTGDGRKDRL